MMPDWFLPELEFAGSEHLDAAYVEQYDDKALVDPTPDLNVLRALGLNDTHSLVDLGAGTGTFALAAAPLCRRVVAVDVSPVMLAVLRQRLASAGVTNVEPVQAGFLSYHHQGAPVDFVYSRHALHHLPDFWKVVALERIAAMLRPGGVLLLRDLIYSCEPGETEAVIERWLGGASTTPGVGWSRAELATHLQDEYSPYSWLLETMLSRVGFDIQAVEHAPSQVYSTYTCVRRE